MTKIQLARITTLISYFGLLTLILLWTTWLSPPKEFPVSFILVIGALPLLLAIKGVLHRKPYTHAWLCMLALAYFIHGVVEAWSMPELRTLASIEAILSFFLYLGAAFYARYRSREIKAVAKDSLNKS